MNLTSMLRTAGTDQAVFDAGLRSYMRKIYNYMAGGLVATGAVALAVANVPALYAAIFGTPLMWLAMLAPLGFLFFLGFRAQRMSVPALRATFWAFCAVMGLSLASVFVAFTGESIARTFFVTAGTFAAMSIWGYTTKRDLSGMGSFLMMGVLGLVIASVVNIFLGSSVLQFAVSAIGVLVFTGLIAFDTQRLKEAYAEGWGQEANDKLAVMGALSLYLNFINLFQFLLQFLGNRE